MALYKLEHNSNDGYTYSSTETKIIETDNPNKIKKFIKQNYPRLEIEVENGYQSEGGYESVTFHPFKVDLKL